MRSYLGNVTQLVWKNGTYVNDDDCERLQDGRIKVLGVDITAKKKSAAAANAFFFDSGGDVGLETVANFRNEISVSAVGANTTITFGSSGDRDLTSIGDYMESAQIITNTQIVSYSTANDVDAVISQPTLSGGTLSDAVFMRESRKLQLRIELLNYAGTDVYPLKNRLPGDGILFKNGLVGVMDSASTDDVYQIAVYYV